MYRGMVSRGKAQDLSQGKDIEERSAEWVLSEYGINMRSLAYVSHVEAEGLLMTKGDVVAGLIYQMIGRFQEMAESIVNRDPDPDVFDEQALGVAYALVPYVGFHAALGLKQLAFNEAQRRYLNGL